MLRSKLPLHRIQSLPNSWSKVVDTIIACVLSCLGPILFPILKFYVLCEFWPQYTRQVDRHNCSCSCWDTVFKGPYESGIASYKHIYFNATSNTAKIWVLTVVCVIALYEALKRLVSLLLERRLRISMFILFSSSLFSNYYSWWSYFNYWNDEFYTQWYHQLFFSLSELVSTCLILRLADMQTPVTLLAVLPVVAVASVHIVVSTTDQFVVNVVQGQGSTHQILRDLGFMFPDVLHILLCLLELLVVYRYSCSVMLSTFLATALPRSLYNND